MGLSCVKQGELHIRDDLTAVRQGFRDSVQPTYSFDHPKTDIILNAKRSPVFLKTQRGLSVLTILAVFVVVALLTYAKVSYDKKQKAKVVAEQMQAAILEKEKAAKLEQVEREKAAKLEQVEREKAEQAEQLKISQAAKDSSDIMLRIQSNVRNSLKDPDSAKFGQFFEVDSGQACIGVNAKNSYGGFTGEKFIKLRKSQSGEWMVDGSSSAEFSDSICRLQSLTKR